MEGRTDHDALEPDTPDSGALEPAVKPKRARKPKVYTAEELCEQGERRLNAHRKAQARESFTKAIELDPECETAWMGLAVAAATEDDRQAALRRVLEINPESQAARSYFERIEQQKREAARRREEYEAFQRQLAEQQTTPPPGGRPSQAQSNSGKLAVLVVTAVLGLALVLLWAGGGLSSQARTEQRPTPAYATIYRSPVPAAPRQPASVGTTRIGAVCNDGSHSGATGSGACSRHGGVARWLYK